MAGRNNKHTVDYFPHMVSHGMKMQYLQSKYQNDGYAVWFKIMERLSKTENHYIDLSDDMAKYQLLTYCLVDESVLYEILDFLSKSGWLHKKLWEQHKVITSIKLLENIQDAYKRRNNSIICISEIELMYGINAQRREEKKREEKKRVKEFVYLSDSELKKLIEKYGKGSTEKMIEKLDNYKGSTGKKYKSDYRAILSWVAKDIVTEYPERFNKKLYNSLDSDQQKEYKTKLKGLGYKDSYCANGYTMTK